MDFIIKRFNKLIDNDDKNTLDYFTHLRERIEYELFFILGFVWNRNLDQLNIDNRERVVADLNKLQIGELINCIKLLDIENLVFCKGNKKGKSFLDKYPAIRNRAIGHGYLHSDMSQEVARELIDLHNDLQENIEILRTEYSIIWVDKCVDGIFHGSRFSDIDGIAERWSCPSSVLEFESNRIYAYDNIARYTKITPFIHFENKGEDKYVFNSLEDKLSGKVKYCKIFSTGTKMFEWDELSQVCFSDVDNDTRIISANKCIMSNFEPNFKKYIDIANGTKKLVNDFIQKNNALVSATIWGHGGVGKTACIQSLCFDYFNRNTKLFDYIVFISAKDRYYDTWTGRVLNITTENRVRSYEEVLIKIALTLQLSIDYSCKSDERIKKVEIQIQACEQKSLIIIDDIETFPKIELEHIENFVLGLNVNYHKVIFTTRAKMIIGHEISVNEMNIQQTSEFLLSIIHTEHPEYDDSLKQIMASEKNVQNIFMATSGRPIFIYHFAHLFVQSGFESLHWKGISSTDSAHEFLYSKLYEYLSSSAKDIFVTIPRLISNDKSFFQRDVLEFIYKSVINDKKFDDAFDELLKLKIIEEQDDSYYRVYSNEIVELMNSYLSKRDMGFQDTIRNKLREIGGPSALKRNIQEARLEDVNKLRQSGNPLEVEERYRQIIKDNDAPFQIRKKALINVCSYFSIERLNPSRAQEIFSNFYAQFSNDSDVTKLYVQTMWANGDNENAVRILRTFLKPMKQSVPENLELYGLYVAYSSDMLLARLNGLVESYSYGGVSVSQYSKDYCGIINELHEHWKTVNRNMFNFLKGQQLMDFPPKIRHNFEMGVSQSAKLCAALGEVYLQSYIDCKKICEYGLLNLASHYHKGLNIMKKRADDVLEELDRLPNISWDEFEKTYTTSSKIYGVIESIESYGLFVKVSDEVTGLLHISQISNAYIECIYTQYKIGHYIQANIVSISANDKKLSLSLLS